MIKKSTYIRSFTPKQLKQMQKIQDNEMINTVAGILLFALDKYEDHRNEILRLNRIIEYKQRKIENLINQDDANI